MKTAGFNDWESFVKDYDGYPSPGTARWYYYGLEKVLYLGNIYAKEYNIFNFAFT